MIVENNDTIYVPPQPVTRRRVRCGADARHHSSIVQGETIGDYLRAGGGVQKIGDKGEIFVVRANGIADRSARRFFGGSLLGAEALTRAT